MDKQTGLTRILRICGYLRIYRRPLLCEIEIRSITLPIVTQHLFVPFVSMEQERQVFRKKDGEFQEKQSSIKPAALQKQSIFQ